MDPDFRSGGWWRGPRPGHGSGHGRAHGHRSHGHGFGFGPGGAGGPGDPGDAPGPGFGPGFPFGPFGAGFGPGFGPGSDPGARHRRRGWGRGRASRGDVRAAVLLLLAEQPMHGYQLMHAVAERSGGRWTPSPGAIYPTLSQLEDEGLVTVTADAGRKLATLTDTGRAAVEELRAAGSDPFTGTSGAAAGPDVRGLLEELHGAVRQVARSGTDAQLAAAAEVLAQARRSLYLLLAEGPDGPPAPPAPPHSPPPPPPPPAG
jgi:DNA-binding PadR family transcriptional regulator